MMKYRLKKNLPCAKAGEIFRQDFDENNIVHMYQESYGVKQHKICLEDIDNFDEWFEEVEEPKICFTIDFYKSKVKEINTDHYSGWSSLEIANIKRLGLLFYIQEEAEKYLEYLKAKEVIKQDTKGFKPNWKNCENKYYGYWDSGKDSLGYLVSYITKYSDICFKTEEDIKESFEKHSKEWKAYLTYEQ